MTDVKDLKKKVRALRKIKKDTQPHTPARRDINRQIREIKGQLASYETQLNATVDDGKQRLIDEITAIRTQRREPILTDLRQYTVEQLQKHLDNLKGKYRQ